jgi:hypothetical protein
MAGIAAYNELLMLNFSLNAVAATRPTNWGVGLSLGSPTSVSGSEIATGSGWTRQSAIFPTAISPAGSATNSVAMTFGPAITPATFSGIQIWDTMSATVGNMLYYGLLATPRTLGSGDSLVIASGALVITLA